MSEIQIEIQGEAATEAAEALNRLDGIDAKLQPTDEEPTREITLVTVVAVITITKGALEIAKLIYDWHKKSLTQGQIEKVIVKGRNGRRITLVNASIEDIQRILEQ